MAFLTARDAQWWIDKEREVEQQVVDLAGEGFVIDRRAFADGWTDDPHCRARPGVVKALVRARDLLPAGHNFKVRDAWRSWPIQQEAARANEKKIRLTHPDWSEDQVRDHLWRMSPPARIVPRLASHRYGGAVDLTIVDASGDELDMGVAVGHCTNPEAALLFYELLPRLSAGQRRYRDNRRMLIRSMTGADFVPYPPEFWHWGFDRDIDVAADFAG